MKLILEDDISIFAICAEMLTNVETMNKVTLLYFLLRI
jgi:hypothetical protein